MYTSKGADSVIYTDKNNTVHEYKFDKNKSLRKNAEALYERGLRATTTIELNKRSVYPLKEDIEGERINKVFGLGEKPKEDAELNIEEMLKNKKLRKTNVRYDYREKAVPCYVVGQFCIPVKEEGAKYHRNEVRVISTTIKGSFEFAPQKTSKKPKGQDNKQKNNNNTERRRKPYKRTNNKRNNKKSNNNNKNNYQKNQNNSQNGRKRWSDGRPKRQTPTENKRLNSNPPKNKPQESFSQNTRPPRKKLRDF